MQDKMWELQMAMNGKLDVLCVDLGVIKNRLDSEDGICEHVRENSRKIEQHQTKFDRMDEQRKTLARVVASAGGATGILAAAKWIFKVI